MPRLAPAVLLAAAVGLTAAPPDGAVPLFNGKDLAGWHNVNCHPGTFFVKDGEIVTTGEPTGFLRSDKQYENFVLEMEWKHVEKEKMANSGLFVWGDPLPAVGTPYTRGIEVQVLANYETDWATSHGDVFSIHGATCTPDRPHPKGAARCLPSERRCKPSGEWNHYKVVCNDGAIKLHVNGKEVSGVSNCHPRKGYLALESEGAECHFRNITIKELPSSNPKPEDVAKVADGSVLLFNGLDLTGWAPAAGWKPAGGKLVCSGTAPLATAKPVGPGQVQFDWKLPAKGAAAAEVTVGGTAVNLTADRPGGWTRSVVPVAAAGVLGFKPAPGLEIMNVYARGAQEK